MALSNKYVMELKACHNVVIRINTFCMTGLFGMRQRRTRGNVKKKKKKTFRLIIETLRVCNDGGGNAEGTLIVLTAGSLAENVCSKRCILLKGRMI